MSELPEDPAAKRAMLNRAFEIGQQIGDLARPGAASDALRDFVANTPELVVQDRVGGLVVQYPGGVTWDVTLGEDGRIEGLGASGYGPLMEALGIDFSGAAYTPGN